MQFNMAVYAGDRGVPPLCVPQLQPALPHFRGGIWIAPL